MKHYLFSLLIILTFIGIWLGVPYLLYSTTKDFGVFSILLFTWIPALLIVIYVESLIFPNKLIE